MARKLSKKEFEEQLNELYGKGEYEINGGTYYGYFGTLLRRHDPIAFNEEWWNSGNGY